MRTIKSKEIGGNIDPETRHTLMCMSKFCHQAVASKIGRKLVNVVNDTSMQDRVMEWIMAKSTPDVARKKLEALMKMNAFPGQSSEEVDAEVERFLSGCLDEQIRIGKKGRWRGLPQLKAPKDDAFSLRQRNR